MNASHGPRRENRRDEIDKTPMLARCSSVAALVALLAASVPAGPARAEPNAPRPRPAARAVPDLAVTSTVAAAAALAAMTDPGPEPPETYDEADVIRAAIAGDPAVRTARAAVAVADARRVEAALYPNPSVSWDRESSAGEREDTLAVSVPIALSSRRKARGLLARAEVDAAGAALARTQRDAVVHALTVFYELVGERARAEIEQRALDRLREAARVVGLRKREGEVSGYEQTRIELEVELAASALRGSRARAETLAHGLALLLDLEPDLVVFDGSLTPGASAAPARPASAGSPESGGSPGPGARAETPRSLALEDAAARHAGEAAWTAWRTWVPTVAITGGLRRVDAGSVEYGYVVGVAIDLPIFGRGQEVRAEARARADHARARARDAERTARVARAQAEQQVAAARSEFEQFAAETRERLDRLARAAESGYREGQRSIVELLDAQRAHATVELHQLELGLRLKLAEVALRAATGEFE